MKTTITLIFFTLYSFAAHSQAKLIGEIYGEYPGDSSGTSVAFSSDGNIVAIGSIGNDFNGVQSGNVRVFEFVSGKWTQMGNDIYGEAANDWSGYSLDLSSDGHTIAIGATGNDGNKLLECGQIRVYQFSNGDWIQKGTDIDGADTLDFLGFSVSMSGDGSIVASGALGKYGIGQYSGKVKVMQYVSGQWTMMGNPISGAAANDWSGSSISLSEDGLTIAIGAPQSSNQSKSLDGHVRVFQYQSGSWVQLGSAIEGKNSGDNSGFSVSLSSDGKIVAIGSPNHIASTNPNHEGQVRIFEYDSGYWKQRGNDIDGRLYKTDALGMQVSLKSDGNTVAISAPFCDSAGTKSGQVQIYQYNSGTWVSTGDRINGIAGEYSGLALSISADGTLVAIGTPYNDSTGQNAGLVRIYQLKKRTGITDQIIDGSVTVYPNPCKGQIKIIIEQNLLGSDFFIYDHLGTLIRSGTLHELENRIDLQALSSGIYSLNILNGGMIETVKISIID